MSDVVRILKSDLKKYELQIIESDDNADNQIIRIRRFHNEGYSPAIAPDLDNDGKVLDMETRREREDKYEQDLMCRDEIFYKRLHNQIMREDFIIKGIAGIKKVYMNTKKIFNEDKDGRMKYLDKEEYILETEGANLKDIMVNDHVDYTRCASNDIYEILLNLGIEATRETILREIRFVLGCYNIYLNYRHLSILIDTMTHRGTLMAITRHGINRNDSGPFLKCSFEETVDQLYASAIFSEID